MEPEAHMDLMDGRPALEAPNVLHDVSHDAFVVPGQTYRVREGDDLLSIARRAYGDLLLWHVIYNANRSLIPDPDVLRPGQFLAIPLR
jgi:nucleoid-associated protein YgaU